MSRPVVLKVGGSLFDWKPLPVRLGAYLESRRREPLVLVPGGGRVVDLVREIDSLHSLGDEQAHRLALHALDFTARWLESMLENLQMVDELDALGRVWQAGRVPVLAPRRFLEHDDRTSTQPLHHSWSVTSDSIAARAAVVLGALELVLLKSVSLPPGTTRMEASCLGLVDPAFPEVAKDLARVTYLNLREMSSLPAPL